MKQPPAARECRLNTTFSRPTPAIDNRTYQIAHSHGVYTERYYDPDKNGYFLDKIEYGNKVSYEASNRRVKISPRYVGSNDATLYKRYYLWEQ